MQAVVMAAGSSTRTHPLTLTRPKPLVPIWDRPLLEHQMRQLAGWIDEAILVVGFLREQIERRARDELDGVRIRYVIQEQQRGTADALRRARALLSSRTLVLNGDDFYHRDDLQALAGMGRGLLVTRARDPENRAVVSIESDLVTGIVEKPENPPRDAWCSVGGYCLEPEDLARLDDVSESPRGELELPDFIRMLIRSRRVKPVRLRRLWLPVTYAWDVLGILLYLWERPRRAEEMGVAAEPERRLRAREDLAIGRGVVLEGPIHLGAGVKLGDGVRLIGPLALGAEARVGEGAHLERSVLFEGARVGEGARVLDSVLGQGASVGPSARLESGPGAELSIEIKGRRVTPDIPRLGCIAGDRVSIEAGASVRPGTLLPAPPSA